MSSEVSEQVPERRCALLRQDAAPHFDAVRQPRILCDVVQGSGSAGLRIPRAEYEARDAVSDDGTRAHRTRLERHEQLASFEPPATKTFVAETQRVQFRVRRPFTDELSSVVCPGDHIFTSHEHCADWYVSVFEGNDRLVQSNAHEPFVAFHAPYGRR